MDSPEVIIARLVLGYLKNEKCRSAYKEFLRTSNNLQGVGLPASKYFPTRFVGLTLEDILCQYFEIYKIVQGRLEATDYFNERHTKNSLVEQLLYLLNKVQTSRTSTPCPRSPADSQIDETSPSHVDPTSDVETTPAHTLPGNVRCISENSYLHKASRRKSHPKYCKSDNITTSIQVPEEVLAQTLLENKEFHEKIAKTINKVAEKQFKVSAELNRTIETVVKETEEDPIFDRILDEIIESATVVTETNKGLETSSTSSSTPKITSQHNDDRPKRTCNHSDSSESQDRGYRSHSESKKMEEQNNEAIRSIVANARLTSNTQTINQESQSNNEIIMFDGSLDKYLISNTCNANTQTQPVLNPLYINATGSLLMVPSAVPTNISGNLQIDSSKQYYFVNKQPTVGWNIPTIKTSNVLTEQDILAMPTVIVNDENKPNNNHALQNPVLKTVKTLPTLLPKPTIEIPAEYFAQFNAENSQQSAVKKVEAAKVKEPSESANINANSSLSTTSNTDDVQNKSLPSDLLNENQGESLQVKTDASKQKVPQIPKVDRPVKTPPPQEPVQKATPKSGSHVRNLDFSTPPKITSTHTKRIKTNRNATPPFVHKKQAAKTLFKSETDSCPDKKTNSEGGVQKKTDIIKKAKRPALGTWDADLRSIIPSTEVDDETPKKKRKQPVAPTKKARRKVKKTRQFNTTEDDGALLEAALKTPVKTNKTGETSAETNIVREDFKKSACSGSDANKPDINRKNNITEFESSGSNKGGNKQNKSEAADDNVNKMILSPSKLNANKRNLVNTDFLSVDETDKFVTPKMAKENIHQPITRARNITALLETPLKTDMLPKTPGPKTPMNSFIDPNLSTSSMFTPFTKMLEANLKGIDFNSLPTPSMPITPSFPPFTPTVDLVSPYSNRPTDYSTSSSYYQPSDSEQNKSLEANVIELERNPIKIHSDILIAKDELVVSLGSKVDTEGSFSETKSPVSVVSEHVNIFNKNVIGKKNLNLMKRDLSSSSSSDESSSETSSEEDDNDSSKNWDEAESNNTVILRRKSTEETPKRTYSLRNRTTTVDHKEAEIKKVEDVKEEKVTKKQPIKNTKVNTKQASKANTKQANNNEHAILKEKEEKKETPSEESTKPIAETNFPQVVLKELEEKRLRTIDKFKNVEKAVSKKPSTKATSRQSKGRFLRIKPIPNLTNTRRPRKSDSPKKTVQKKAGTSTDKPLSTTKDALCDNKNKDDILLQLHVSEDDDTDLTKNPLDKCTNSDKDTERSLSDVEADNLIKDLKERGIHLMPNKSSPTKKVSDTEPSIEPKLSTNDIKEVVGFGSSGSSTQNDSSEVKENSHSTSQLESELRDVYDTCVFDTENEHVIFDESKNIRKTFLDVDVTMLSKTFVGKVFIEEINSEINIPMVFTPFYTLLDIPPATEKSQSVTQSRTCTSKEANEKSCQDSGFIKDVICTSLAFDETPKSDDDLMNYAIVGSTREETPERSDSSKGSKKRKLRNEENSHTEKKCKTLLKKINVDTFLNNIHGGS